MAGGEVCDVQTRPSITPPGRFNETGERAPARRWDHESSSATLTLVLTMTLTADSRDKATAGRSPAGAPWLPGSLSDTASRQIRSARFKHN